MRLTSDLAASNRKSWAEWRRAVVRRSHCGKKIEMGMEQDGDACWSRVACK